MYEAGKCWDNLLCNHVLS